MTRLVHAAGIAAVAALAVLASAIAVSPVSGGAPVELLTRSGFGPLDDRSDGRTRWLEGDTGRLELSVRGGPHRVAVGIELSSFAQPRRVEVTLAGRTVTAGRVPPSTFTTLRADLGEVPAGRYVLTVQAEPGPQSIAQTVGVPDPRTVSVRLRALTVRDLGGEG